VTIRARRLATYAVDWMENPNIIEANRQCGNDALEHDAVVEIATDDESIRGVFYATLGGDGPSLDFAGSTDTRNFSGSLEFPVDPTRVHFAEVVFRATLGADMAGLLLPAITYVDDEAWEEALGICAFWPAVNMSSDLFCTSITASDGPEMFSFDSYPGSDPPALFPVVVQLNAGEPGSADLQVEVAGERHDFPMAQTGDKVSLGEYPIGTAIQLKVTNTGASDRVIAVFIVNACGLSRASCDGASCEGSAELVVSPMDCRGLRD
jgi:hypothetical protein